MYLSTSASGVVGIDRLAPLAPTPLRLAPPVRRRFPETWIWSRQTTTEYVRFSDRVFFAAQPVADFGVGASLAGASADQAAALTAPTVRKHFPETWVWIADQCK